MTKSTYKKKKQQLQRQAKVEAEGDGSSTVRTRPSGPRVPTATKAQQAREAARKRERSLSTRIRRNPWPLVLLAGVVVLAGIIIAVNVVNSKNNGGTTTAANQTATAAAGVPVSGTATSLVSVGTAAPTTAPVGTSVANPTITAAIKLDEATATAVAAKGLFPTPTGTQPPNPPANYKAVAVNKGPITKPVPVDSTKLYIATFVTNKGTFKAALDPKLAPITVSSMVGLIKQHFYDGVSFHRYVPGFVIQGGDPTGTGSSGPTLTGGQTYTFTDESVLGDYKTGSLAMANSGPNTNGSQFFICLADQTQGLGKQYNLFGQIISGMDVVLSLRWGDVMKTVTVTAV